MKFFVLTFLSLFAISFAEEVRQTAQINEETNTYTYETLEASGEIQPIGQNDEENIELKKEEKTKKKNEDESDVETEIDPDRTTSILTIISEPVGATILINRRISGTTPFSADEIEPQDLNIMLLKDGFQLFDSTVVVTAGANDTIVVSLVPDGQVAGVITRRSTGEIEAEIYEDDDEAVVAEEDLVGRRRRADRIGIIVFLSVMIMSMGMQEFRSR